MHISNFNFEPGSFIVSRDNFTLYERTGTWSTKINSTVVCVIPTNTILRIENVTMEGSAYQSGEIDIIFSFLITKNKHMAKNCGIPKSFRFTLHQLNGFMYDTILDATALDIEINRLLRTVKIDKIIA